MRAPQTLLFCSLVAMTACTSPEPGSIDDEDQASADVTETCGTITAQSMIETDTTTIVCGHANGVAWASAEDTPRGIPPWIA